MFYHHLFYHQCCWSIVSPLNKLILGMKMFLRKVSSSPLILGQSNRTQLFSILSGKPFKNCALCNHGYPGVGSSLKFGACQHHPHTRKAQRRKEMSNERRYTFHIWMVSSISIKYFIKEEICKVSSPTDHSLIDS